MKRQISLLLAIFMLVTILPIGVYADTLVEPTATPTAGTISTVQSEIVLDFGVEINPDTIGGITFTKTGGTAIKGAYSVSADATDAKLVRVKFGKLEDGEEYTLTVPTTVVDASGNALAETATFAYTAQKQYITNTDFSGDKYTANTAPTQGEDNIVYATGGKASTSAATVLSETTDGVTDNYVRVTGTTNGQNAILFGLDAKTDDTAKALFGKDTIDKDKVLVLEMGVRVNGDSKFLGGHWKLNSEGVMQTVGYTVPATITYGAVRQNSTNQEFTLTAHAATGTSTSKWFKPTLVMRRDTTDGKTYTDIYDTDIYDNVNGYVATSTDSEPETSEATKISLVAFYSSDTAQYADATYVRAYNDILLGVVKAEEYSNATRQIVLYMSDDMNTDSVTTETVTVWNGDTPVTGITVTPNNTDRTITIAFPYEMDTATYTIKLAGLKASSGIKGYDENVSFNVVAEANLAAPVPSIASGEIDTTAGEITLTFGSEINKDTISGITFTKANEEEIKGIYTVTRDEVDTNKIKVEFGRLEAEKGYVLTVPTTVKDIRDRTLTETATFTYTAKQRYITNTDFSEAEYVTGQPPTQGEDNIVYVAGQTATNATAQVLEETVDDGKGGTTDKFVRVYASSEGTGANQQNAILVGADAKTDDTAKALFGKDTIDKDKVLVLEMGVRVNGDSKYLGGHWKLLANNGMEVVGYTAPATITSGAVREYNSSALGGGLATNQPFSLTLGAKTDGKSNWFEPTLVMRRDATDGKTYTDIYDNVNGYVATSTDSEPETSEATKISLVAFYSSDTAQYADATYVRARQDRLIKVLKQGDYANKSIKLFLSDDVDVQSARDDIKVYDKAGTEVEDKDVYIDEDRGISLRFNAGLDLGTYTIDLSNLKATNGLKSYTQEVEFEVTVAEPALRDIEFTDQAGVSVRNQTDLIAAATEINLSATLKNYTSDCVGFFAVYGENNRLLKVVPATFGTQENGTRAVSATVDFGIQPGGATNAKVFVWKDLATIEPIVHSSACL